MAGREYEVGGTVYEFPDSYDDAKVKGILTQKGVIKAPKVAKPGSLKDLTEQSKKYPVMGGPVLPAGAIIPAAVGMGTEALGRKAGLPEWVNIGAGAAAGLAAGGAPAIGRAISKIPTSGIVSDIAGVISPRASHAINLVNRVRKVFGLVPQVVEETAPGLPVRPNPNIARKIKYGGPTEPMYSAPGTTIPRKGFTPPAEPVPTPPTPFKPSSGVARTMKYGGPADPGYGAPGKVIPRGKFTPPTEPASTPYQPVRPNPNILKKLRSGGSEDPYGGRAYRSTPRRAGTKALPTETEEAIRETLPTKAGTAKPVRETDISEQLQESIAAQHKVKVSKVVNLLKSSGIDAEMAKNANEAQIKDILKQADVRNFHDLDTAWNEIVDALGGKSWPAKGPTPPMPPSRFGK